MKKLLAILVLGLLWCNVGFAELISITDIKIGDRVSEHFTSKQISEYYIHDAGKTAKGERVYGKDLKYSIIQTLKEDGIFKEDYDWFQIYYENGTDKIVSIAGVDKMLSKDSCFEKRKNDVAMYIKKNRITSLFNKHQDAHTFPDGMIDDYVQFFSEEKSLYFSCYIYPDDRIRSRVEVYENNYDNYIFKKFNEE